MSFLKQHEKPLILLLVLGVGIIIAAPYTNFQNFLAQGDHGLGLYVPQAVNRGEIPYRDFWWPFGPLMPYYYALFYKIFGVKISSIILGKLLLKILAGILVCVAMMEVSSTIAAFICACWYMLFAQDFFYGYNHIGGIVMVLGVAFCLLSYIKKNSSKAAFGALGFIFTLCLIKINFGLAALAVSVITVWVSDLVQRIPLNKTKVLFYAAAFIGLPLLLFIIYWSLLKNLSLPEIQQCLPYTPGYDPSNISPWIAIKNFIQITSRTITFSWENFVFAVIINASALRCFYLYTKNRLPAANKKTFILSLGMLCLFYVLNCHEYIKSGVWYRIFWAQPLSIMITFLLIDTATQSIPKIIRNTIFLFLTIMVIFCGLVIQSRVNVLKTPGQYFSLPRGGIYITNSPDWISTVEQTTDFLNKTLKPHELFFALPYDCLYYYLTDKKSPTRQLIFFDYLHIPKAQERSVIAELKKNHVHYILLSNRAFVHQEPGLGILGTSYCPLISKYIQDNFVPIARFGDWSDEPGWAWNHGTIILKHK